MVLIIGVIALITINLIILSITSKSNHNHYGLERWTLPLIAPFQKTVTGTINSLRDLWRHYFFLVSAAEENERLRTALRREQEKNLHLHEIALSNARLRKLLSFQKNIEHRYISAEVIGKDPSSWFKTIIIDKGFVDGIDRGYPVVVTEGIVGQIMAVSDHYAKVLLIIDSNSAADALVQRTRARGIIQGQATDQYIFKYVLRKYPVRVDDIVVSSGLDGVFPKGISIGRVSSVTKGKSGIFQEINVTPSVDFEKLEEVLVLLIPSKHEVVKSE